MEPSQQPDFDESVAQVMRTLPPVIRTYLLQGKLTPVVKDLTERYSLRIDQGGVLERETMLLLMGVEDPTEFIQALTELGLDKETVNGIVQDVNDQIFVPLQKEMKGEKVGMQQPPKVTAPSPVVVNQPMATYIPPPQSPSYSRPSNGLISSRPASLPAFPRVTPPSLNATRNAVRAAMSAASKPIVDEKLIEDHEEPHIEFNNKAPVPPLSQPVTPPPPSPPNLPGATSPILSSKNAPPIVRSYSSDPYREPIDENEK